MSRPRPSRRTRSVALAAALGATAIVAVPSSASAADPVPNSCDASALQLSLLGSANLDPARANAASNPCKADAKSVLDLPLAPIANIGAVRSSTAVTTNKVATSTSEVAGARVGASDALVSALVGPLLSGQNSIVGQITTQLDGALASGPLTALSPLITALLGPATPNGGSITTALTASLPAALKAALPDVLSTGLIRSTATATCQDGTARLAGTSSIADLKVLGTPIDANGAANQILNLDTTKLNLGQLLNAETALKGIKVGNTTLYDTVKAIPGLGPVLLNTLQSTLQPVLNQIQINLPANLLRVAVSPNTQTTSGGQLTQRALSIDVSALGQPLLGGVLAEARVGAGAPDCAGSAVDAARFPSPEAAAVLKCSKTPSTLIDVYGKGSKTYVQGVAETRFVGKKATIRLRHGNKKVGTATIRKSGLFSRNVALPPKSIRNTNKARYYAVVGGKKTRALKFARRMETTSITSSGGRVRFAGRVLPPLQQSQKRVLIQQRITCTKYKTVATLKPDSKGRFKTSVKAPASDDAGIYRAQTKVIKRVGSQKLFPTFTLPRVVGIKR